MKEEVGKQNLSILTVCYCKLPSTALVNSFCHKNVQASDSKSDTQLMVLSEMDRDLCAAPSLINRHVEISESYSCIAATFTATALLTPHFVFTSKFMTGKLSRLLHKLKKQYGYHLSKHR